MGKIKILHLITTLEIGGAQGNTLLTVEKLPRDKYEVHLAGASGKWREKAAACADRLFVLKHMKRAFSPFHDVLALVEVVRILKGNDYILLHTHSSKAGFIGRLAAKLCGIPAVIHTVHGLPFHDRTFSPFFRAIFLLLEKIASHWCGFLVFVSRKNYEEALELNIAPGEKQRHIISGIEMDRFPAPGDRDEIKRKIGLDTRLPVIGTVGRIAPSSGTDLFIGASLKLLESRPDIQILIVGDGPMRDECAGLIGGDRRFFLTGWTNDVPLFLRAIDIFVSPVRWGGVGRALTEAMACSLPVIACDADGVSEVVKDHHTGLLIPPDDEEEMAAKLVYLLENREIGVELGERAGEAVREKYSSRIMVGEIMKLYEEILSETA